MKGKLNSESIFGITTSMIALIFIKISLEFKAGTRDGVPGPGYFPILVSYAVLVFSVILIFRGFRQNNEYFKIDSEKSPGLAQMAAIIASMGAFLVLWRFLPFLVAGVLFVLNMCRILKQKWRFSVIYSVAVVGVLYLIFSVAFRVNLNMM